MCKAVTHKQFFYRQSVIDQCTKPVLPLDSVNRFQHRFAQAVVPCEPTYTRFGQPFAPTACVVYILRTTIWLHCWLHCAQVLLSHTPVEQGSRRLCRRQNIPTPMKRMKLRMQLTMVITADEREDSFISSS